ncbi:MAG TPA: helix-turn-helix transcriptional regulator [Bacteroidia bacterium]|jgi:putative transcriptional regulator|nr:helix-turn-helix transcriptional regulator [Bacteroidia bacterium]
MNKERELKKLGTQIRQVRNDKGLTLEELASKSDKAYQVLQRLETGKENPSMYLLAEIASGMKMTLEALLKGIN